jgi:hypothetical protein
MCSRSPTSTTPAPDSTSTPVPDWLRRLAACPPAFDDEIPPGFERLLDERLCVLFGPNGIFANVYPFRLDDVPAVVEEVRAAARERRAKRLHWNIGPDAEPRDLSPRLRTLGLVDDDPTTALVLQREPPRVESVEARPVRSIGELRLAAEIAHEAFGDPPDRLQAVLENLREEWEQREGRGSRTFLAFVDGEPVGAARSVYFEGHLVLLVSGGVLPGARGRGAYRALVRARWEDAVQRGTPILLVFGGPMSRPILERSGFQPIFDLEVLTDELGAELVGGRQGE